MALFKWRKIELHPTSSTFTPLDFKDFIPASDSALTKASELKPGGLEPGTVAR